jgi:hypothetical protein
MRLVRRLWRRYLVLLAVFASGAAVTMIFLPPLGRAFFAGVYLTSWGALIAYSLMLDGSQLRLMGAEAEAWTSQALRKLKGWWVIDAVEFADWDIDHVAVSAARVLAVETKWTSRAVCIDQKGVHGLHCDGVAQAARGAKRVANLLASRGIDHPVTPVLIVWGPEVASIQGGYQRIGDVRVLTGKQANEWRDRLAPGLQGAESTAGVREVIEEYVRRFDAQRKPSALSRQRGGRRPRPAR